jgi:hypothetical protein
MHSDSIVDSIVDSMALNVRLKFMILPRPTAHLEIALHLDY